MPTTKTLRLTLVRAPDDEASFSPGYQTELRQFYSLASAEGCQIRGLQDKRGHVHDGQAERG
jgi:hypothetical protein